MRFFHLENMQDLYGFLFPTLIFMIIFGLFLYRSHFFSRDAEKKKSTIIYTYPGGIQDRDAPFPLAMTLVIVGVLIWAACYILGYGLLEVRI